jgi:pimeloyl-ACP methyl ester carboxylesterase
VERAVTEHTSSSTSFGPVKQVDAGVLNIGYVESGPTDGTVALLLHGWPYDIHSYAEVTPLLTAQGYRVIVPHLRGYGTTRFLSEETRRNGEQAALAGDNEPLAAAVGAVLAAPGLVPLVDRHSGDQ